VQSNEQLGIQSLRAIDSRQVAEVTMRKTEAGICSALLTIVILGSPLSAAAQTDLFAIPPGPKRVDLSGSGGFLLSTDWSDLVLLGSVSTVSGTLEQVLVRDLQVEPGPVFDGVVTYWEGRYGFRAHGGYASSCLAPGGNCGSGAIDVKAYMYDIGGSIGLMDYRRGALAWPYAFVTLGAITYDLERTIGPPLSFIEHRPPGTNADRVFVFDDPDQLLIAIDELGVETRFALNLGVGADLRIPLGPASVGLRLEVSDSIHRSPVDLRVADVERAGTTQFIDFGYVHNMRAAAGLVIQFGR
jgi:hypothetical protein